MQKVGADTELLPSPAGLEKFGGMVLPGVGSFGDCARSLRERKLDAPILEWLRAGKPFLGICLGYQILFDSSEESLGEKGLGFFSGTVRKFPLARGVKVPHMGWNQLRFPGGAGAGVYAGIAAGAFTYFVHSYYPCPEDESLVTAWSDHALLFAASCGRDKVQAVQFHPEKSQALGLAILRNFVSNMAEETE